MIDNLKNGKITTRIGIITGLIMVFYLLAPIVLDFILILSKVKKDFTFNYGYDYWILGIGTLITIYLLFSPDRILTILGIGEEALKSKTGANEK